jgi:tetratricopeptide (TPR) repeat protein
MRLNLILRGRTMWQRELHLTFTSASPLKVRILDSREERSRLRLLSAENSQRKSQPWSQANGSWSRRVLLLVVLLSLPWSPALAQDTTPQQESQVEGIVRDSAGKPVAGVSILLAEESGSTRATTRTNAEGAFAFLAVRAGRYTVKLEKPGFRDVIEDSKLAPAEKKHCEFVLRTSAEASALSSPTTSPLSAAIELDDRPTFTVAGITDSTGSGGHGSETRRRTGEVLARETLNLGSGKSREVPTTTPRAGAIDSETLASEDALYAAVRHTPQSFESNHQLGEFYLHSERCREAIPLLETAYTVNPGDHPNAFDLAVAFEACGEFVRARERVDQMLKRDKDLGKREEADLRRLLGNLDEKLEDPLAAVREYEQAAGLDSSEQNYFAWGAELLLHRAAAPAIDVFGKGARLHPDSARMRAGLGAALYTTGSADEAAQRLCEASDLEPENSAPYLLLGKMQEASSTPLNCAEQKLARFAQDQPENALADYYYALAIWKRDRGSQDPDALEHAQALLEKSSAIDPKLDVAYLQLGNLYFFRGSFQEALAAYQKAIAANPLGSEAHYRLGLAYKRIGDGAKAQVEFEQYKQLDKTEAATIERQRRELRQFLFVLKDQPANAHPISEPLAPSVAK